MANSRPNGNALQIEQALANARQQEEAQRAFVEMLRATIANPQEVRRHNANLVAVAHEGDTPMLLIALPTGTRLDVPLTAKAAQRIGEALIEGPEVDEPAESTSEGGVVLPHAAKHESAAA